jgi:hypothetical protein
MMDHEWAPAETTTHQDHVIAHVIGASVLGYFVMDETLHLVLDMGFIWNVYLDGQMGLLPQAVALTELAIDNEARSRLRCELELLEKNERASLELKTTSPAPGDCLITEVSFLGASDRRRLILHGETTSLIVETDLVAREFTVNAASAVSES